MNQGVIGGRRKTLMVLPWNEEIGGVPNVAQNLARYLESHGYDVIFFFPGTSVLLKASKYLGFRAMQLRLTVPFGKPRPLLSSLAFPLLFPVTLLQLLFFLRRNRIRIINLHYPIDHFFYFAICKRLLPVQLVTSVHGGDAFSKGQPKEKYSKAFKYVIHSSDLIILPCDAYRKKFLQIFPRAQDKTTFIHNGVTHTRFSSAIDSQEVNQLRRYILCIAYLEEYKGVDILLHAAKPLLEGDQSLELVLAGDGPQREELERLALSLGIRNRTQFLGTQRVTEIARLLQGCELLVLPSREEAFGIVILEAMAARKAVVATAVGGIPEIIEHEVSGILVDPENPGALREGLLRVLTDSVLKNKLAENGHSRVKERFSFDHTGSAYLRAFAALLGDSDASTDSPAEAATTHC